MSNNMTRLNNPARDLAERRLGDEGDLSSNEITSLAQAYIGLEEQLETRENLLRDLRHALRSMGFGPEYGRPGELDGLCAVIDATIGLTPVRPSTHPSLAGSSPATIAGDGSGVALLPIKEGFSPPRTWDPSGGAGSPPATNSGDAGAEDSFPASES